MRGGGHWRAMDGIAESSSHGLAIGRVRRLQEPTRGRRKQTAKCALSVRLLDPDLLNTLLVRPSQCAFERLAGTVHLSLLSAVFRDRSPCQKEARL